MAFNRNHGSFVEEKSVSGKFKLQFGPQSKILEFENIHLAVDRHPFILQENFFLNVVPAPFKLIDSHRKYSVQKSNFAIDA